MGLGKNCIWWTELWLGCWWTLVSFTEMRYVGGAGSTCPSQDLSFFYSSFQISLTRILLARNFSAEDEERKAMFTRWALKSAAAILPDGMQRRTEFT